MRVDQEKRMFVTLTARELLEKLLDRDVRKGPLVITFDSGDGRSITVRGGTDLTISFSEKVEK